jgi:hypothetical protein
MMRAADDARRAGRGFRLGGWLGILSGMLCAIPGVGLLFWPMFQELPQQDRPYGWLLDRVAPFAGIGLVVTAVAFFAIARLCFVQARRRRSAGG